MQDIDERMMKRALELAERGLGRVEPNPAVGAVIVNGDTVVGEGWHRAFGGPHAEIDAIAEAGESARGATLYVTLEPCCHHGKTPPCTDAIIAAGIARVVVAMQDPFHRVAGGGLAQLRDAGITVEIGLCETEAVALNAPYCKLQRTGLPFITAKWAMTLDGKTATAAGDSRWISSETSRQIVHQMRDRCDAILVGARTAMRDDPMLTCRLPGGQNPIRIVVDTRARLPLTANLLKSIREAPVWVACGASAPAKAVTRLEDAGCRVLRLPELLGSVDVRALAEALGKEPVTHVLLEGGGTVAASFFEAQLVDRVMVFVAPILLGGEHAPTAIGGVGVKFVSQAWRLENVRTRHIADDLLIEGDVRYGEGG